VSAPRSDAGIYLSVVIPVYNEVARLPSTLREIADYLRPAAETWEVVVVDDGSTDETAAWAEGFCREEPAVRLLRLGANRGKGAAVRAGMLAARGEYVLFSDADLSAPIAEAPRLLEPLRSGYDVAFGSRALKRELIEVHQSRFREASGQLFNFVLRIVTGLPFRDTQCGFKAFRREAAQRVFPLQTIEGFGFDPELLYIARKLGYRLLEVPVRWAHSEGTKVSPLRDGTRMACDLVRIRWNDLRGKYSATRREK
jgi:glycosyltransferase involved in cell wall biosynthesis